MSWFWKSASRHGSLGDLCRVSYVSLQRSWAPTNIELLKLIHRWRAEASRAGREIDRICVAFEAGRDGFWLARWLAAKGLEAYVIHSASVAVSREHRRAKTDRLDTELLKRAFLGWLRGEPGHCGMAAIPSVEEEERWRGRAASGRSWSAIEPGSIFFYGRAVRI